MLTYVYSNEVCFTVVQIRPDLLRSHKKYAGLYANANANSTCLSDVANKDGICCVNLNACAKMNLFASAPPLTLAPTPNTLHIH